MTITGQLLKYRLSISGQYWTIKIGKDSLYKYPKIADRKVILWMSRLNACGFKTCLLTRE